jgi:PAS domain S-box-containing protein
LLAAIIENSDDAILTKDLNGIITSWNPGAQRLFGYAAEEVIGRPVTILIPDERYDEESAILARLRRGERVETYETVRKRKDGTLIDISLTVSPLKDDAGNVFGASKIARDITDRRRALERQQLLLREMRHRINNVFALVGSIVRLSATNAKTPTELAETVQQRFRGLAAAHALTVSNIDDETEGSKQTTLRDLLGVLIAPYIEEDRQRIRISGDDLRVASQTATPLALLFNELLTNAVKYGALRRASGVVEIECTHRDEEFVVTWRERGDLPIRQPPGQEGFGTKLIKSTIEEQLGGTISREWTVAGLSVTVTVDVSRLAELG